MESERTENRPSWLDKRVVDGAEPYPGEPAAHQFERLNDRLQQAEHRLQAYNHSGWWSHRDPRSAGCPTCDLLVLCWRLMDWVRELGEPEEERGFAETAPGDNEGAMGEED